MLKISYLAMLLIAFFTLSGCGSVPINQIIDANTTNNSSNEPINQSTDANNTNVTNNSGSEQIDNRVVDTTYYRTHHQGEDCLACHGSSSSRSENEDDSDEEFTSGATIFTKLDASETDKTAWANQYTIRLILENNISSIVYSKGRGTANANVFFDTGTVNNFTAQVLDVTGVVVNSSVINSHDVSRLRCNTCHSATGSDGAPGRIVNFNQSSVNEKTTAPTQTIVASDTTQTTAQASSFSKDVMPILEAKCKSCHGSFAFIRKFRVKDSTGTYNSLVSNSLVDSLKADNSLLLQKGGGRTSHNGGNALSTQANYDIVQKWISEGAKNN